MCQQVQKLAKCFGLVFHVFGFWFLGWGVQGDILTLSKQKAPACALYRNRLYTVQTVCRPATVFLLPVRI